MTAAVGGRPLARGAAGIASAAVTGAILGIVYARVHNNRMAPWILGRASGIVAYLLLVAVILLGLSLSHPYRSAHGRSLAMRMRVHVTLSLLAFGLLVLHVVVLATDRYAGVGWWGAALPMGSHYRPTGVSLGVIGAWIGMLSGFSAAAAGRLPGRLWVPLHRVAAVSFVLIWLHGVLAGSDTAALLWLYLGTGMLVVLAAASRYFSKPVDSYP